MSCAKVRVVFVVNSLCDVLITKSDIIYIYIYDIIYVWISGYLCVVIYMHIVDICMISIICVHLYDIAVIMHCHIIYAHFESFFDHLLTTKK